MEGFRLKMASGGIFFGVAIAIFVFTVGVLFIPFVIDSIDNFRVNLDCSNPTISDGTKITCLFGDLVIPYLIWFFVSLAIGIVAGANK